MSETQSQVVSFAYDSDILPLILRQEHVAELQALCMIMIFTVTIGYCRYITGFIAHFATSLKICNFHRDHAVTENALRLYNTTYTYQKFDIRISGYRLTALASACHIL